MFHGMSEEVLVVEISEAEPCVEGLSLRLVNVHDEACNLFAKKEGN